LILKLVNKQESLNKSYEYLIGSVAGKPCSDQKRELSWMKNQPKEGEESSSTCADIF
jgi:hypothetical protein